MEVGLAAQNPSSIPASLRGLRKGAARAGCRPSHAKAVAFASCKRVSRQLCSRLGDLAVWTESAKVAHLLCRLFCLVCCAGVGLKSEHTCFA